MKIDLSDIARGRRLTAVTALEMALIARRVRPARLSGWRRALRRLALRLR